MLSKPVYLLICLIEECAEVIQRCCKAIRFGFDEVQPGQFRNNLERIETEIQDLYGVIRMFDSESETHWALVDEVDVEMKGRKVESFMPLSRERGMLAKENPNEK